MFKRYFSLALMVVLILLSSTALADQVVIRMPVKIGMLYEDQTYTLKPTVENISLSSLKWETSDPAVVTVKSRGRLTGKEMGLALVRASGKGVSDTCGVVILPKEIKLKAGETFELPSNAVLEYVTANAGVAKVSKTGVITGVSAGTTKVGVRFEKVGLTVTVRVEPGATASRAPSATATPAPTAAPTTAPTAAPEADKALIKMPVAVDMIYKGENHKIKPVLQNVKSSALKWESNNSSIVSVSSSGRISGKKVGLALVRASGKGASDTCGIVVLPKSVTLKSGDTYSLPYNSILEYASANSAVAAVSRSGMVTAVAGGTTKVGVRHGSMMLTVSIRVEGAPAATAAPAPTATPIPGKPTSTARPNVTPAPTATPAPGKPSIKMPVTIGMIYEGNSHTLVPTLENIAAGDLKWESNAASVVTVDANGKITGVKEGLALVRASGKGVSSTCGVVVLPKEISVRIGESYRLPSNAAIEYVASNSKVAKISSSGVVTGVSEGKAMVGLRHGNVGLVVNVNVTASAQATPAATATPAPTASAPTTAPTVAPTSTPAGFYHSKAAELECASETDQIVLVEYQGGSSAIVSFHEKVGDLWVEMFSTNGYVGSAGIGKKAEGDNKTPSGTYNLTSPFGIKANPGSGMPYTQVSRYHYWGGTSGTPLYNAMFDSREVNYEPQFTDERLIDYAGYYNYCLFIDYNAYGAPDKGSCIFLHCTGSKTSTAGCIAIPEKYMKRAVSWAQKGAKIVIR